MKDNIRSKGTFYEQMTYFINANDSWSVADNETGRVRLEQKRMALWSKARALILQNPKPEYLKKQEVKLTK